MNRVDKINSLTAEQIEEMARITGRPVEDIVADLISLKKEAGYWKTPVAKEAAKRYRVRRAARLATLKDML